MVVFVIIYNRIIVVALKYHHECWDGKVKKFYICRHTREFI